MVAGSSWLTSVAVSDSVFLCWIAWTSSSYVCRVPGSGNGVNSMRGISSSVAAALDAVRLSWLIRSRVFLTAVAAAFAGSSPPGPLRVWLSRPSIRTRTSSARANENGSGWLSPWSNSTDDSSVLPRMRLAWKNAHWSPARDWCWAASDRWYMAWVISLDDSPANAVARTVSTTGVVVRMVPHRPFDCSLSAEVSVAGSGSATGALHREDKTQ